MTGNGPRAGLTASSASVSCFWRSWRRSGTALLQLECALPTAECTVPCSIAGGRPTVSRAAYHDRLPGSGSLPCRQTQPHRRASGADADIGPDRCAPQPSGVARPARLSDPDGPGADATWPASRLATEGSDWLRRRPSRSQRQLSGNRHLRRALASRPASSRIGERVGRLRIQPLQTADNRPMRTSTGVLDRSGRSDRAHRSASRTSHFLWGSRSTSFAGRGIKPISTRASDVAAPARGRERAGVALRMAEPVPSGQGSRAGVQRVTRSRCR